MQIAADHDWQRWKSAAADAGIDGRITGMLNSLSDDIAARGPTCWSSGKCCNFNAYGHRLYVTGLEVCWTLLQIQARPTLLPLLEKPVDLSAACPFQVDKLCGVHAMRPMGCRVYFCQQGTAEWQNQLYEKYQAQIRELHNELQLPYQYAEWRALLAEAKAVGL
jgi:Fe-S-cluster containining protein